MSDRLMAALRALYVEGAQSGAEEAAEVAGGHCRDAYDLVWSNRQRVAANAGRFFDGEDPSGPEWPALREVLDAVADSERPDRSGARC